MLHTILHPCV